MSSSVQQLDATSFALRDALTRQDWTAIGELDLRCREAIEAAMQEVGDEQQLRTSLESLLGLYRELVSVCQAEQARVAAELVQLNQSRQVAKVYQLFG